MKRKMFVFGLVLVVALSMAFAAGNAEKKSTGNKLTYWAPLNANITPVVQDFSQTYYWKEMMKRLDVDIEFQHVSSGNDSVMSEGFNILIASGNYPDIIEYIWLKYPGGPQAAIDDKVIIPLNDVFEKYAPNITAFLEKHPDIKKMISTDDGTYYCFPFLRGESYENNNLVFTEGWVWRQDLLEKAGITVTPRTPTKSTQPSRHSRRWASSFRSSAQGPRQPRSLPGFDSFDDFYVEDGVVHHGLYEASRRDYLAYAKSFTKRPAGQRLPLLTRTARRSRSSTA